MNLLNIDMDLLEIDFDNDKIIEYTSADIISQVRDNRRWEQEAENRRLYAMRYATEQYEKNKHKTDRRKIKREYRQNINNILSKYLSKDIIKIIQYKMKSEKVRDSWRLDD